LATANVRFPTALGLFGLLFGLLVLVLQPSWRRALTRLGMAPSVSVQVRARR